MKKATVARARRAALCLMLPLLPALPLAAAANPDLIVTKFTDSQDGACNADCSLREAVQQANNTPGLTRIVLAAGTYTLTLPPEQSDRDDPLIDDDANANGDLDVRGRLVIAGNGIDRTAIDGTGIDRVLEVLAGAEVTLMNLTVTHGLEPFGGGGIAVNAGGTLSLQYCGVTANQASAAFAEGSGGGILNDGTLTVQFSRIESNRSGAGEGHFGQGGGIRNRGTLTVRETRFIGNRASDDDDASTGGGLWNSGQADVRRSSFEGNAVDTNGEGSAIFNTGGGNLRLENSTVAGSSNGEFNGPVGAVVNGGRYGSAADTLRITYSTIADNNNVGLVNSGTLSILDSIIVGNGFKDVDGGGASAVHQNCLNTGSVYRYSQTALLRGTDTGNCVADILVADSKALTTVLYPLDFNNWVVPSFALRRGSPAVDAASGACPATDQRRVTRPRDGNGDGVAICDLGAYERTKP